MISLAAFLAWFVEIVLEGIGSLKAFRYRRQIPVLYWFLEFAFCCDLWTLWVYIGEKPFYAWASWFDYMGHWLFLCFLGCQVCGKLLGDGKRIVYPAFSVCVLVGTIATLIWFQADTLKDQLLDGASAADACLLTLLALAFVLRRAKLDAQWKWIGLGIVTQIGWDLLCSVAWGYWSGAAHMLPIGEITALLMWNYAVKAELSEVSIPLGHRVVTSENVRSIQ